MCIFWSCHDVLHSVLSWKHNFIQVLILKGLFIFPFIFKFPYSSSLAYICRHFCNFNSSFLPVSVSQVLFFLFLAFQLKMGDFAWGGICHLRPQTKKKEKKKKGALALWLFICLLALCIFAFSFSTHYKSLPPTQAFTSSLSPPARTEITKCIGKPWSGAKTEGWIV